jgi:hypothetical protein
MSFAKNALCSSIAAAAIVTTFALFAPQAEIPTAMSQVAPRDLAGETTPSRRAVRPVVAASSDDAACTKARRRLWVDGEGWVVRRIAICQ